MGIVRLAGNSRRSASLAAKTLQLAAFPVLSSDEERDLAQRARSGDESAQLRLVQSHLRLVAKLARPYRATGLPLSDLMQEGVIGLLHAVRKFNPDKDARLATYAAWWVRSAIQDHVIRSWSIVRIGTTSAQKSLFLQLRKRLAEGAGNLSDETAISLAQRFGATAADVWALARRVALPDASIDQRAEMSDHSIAETLPAPDPSPEEIVVERLAGRTRRQALAAALAALSPRERLIIMRRHLAEACPSLETVAREVGLSKERVRQLEKAALAKLRSTLQPALQQG
jgi:RNA polymerase sigma-32 factor